MRLIKTSALLLALSVAACGPGAPALDTDDQQASYALGLDVGGQFQPAEGLLDVAAFMAGFEDALNEAEPRLETSEIGEILQEFSQRVREQQMARMEEQPVSRIAHAT